MTKLSTFAEAALLTLEQKHNELMIAKANLELEMKQQLREKLESYVDQRDVAMRIALEAGVPKTKLGKAIGTSNYATVQEILANTENNVVGLAEKSSEWSLAENGDGTHTLTIFSMGPSGASGVAVVKIEEDDINYVDGDAFVIAQVYKNGHARNIIDSI